MSTDGAIGPDYPKQVREWVCGLLLAVPVAILAGSASALFLWSLDRVTGLRFHYPWLLFLLPAGGPLIVWVYARWGGEADRGTNLLLDEIHEPQRGVPLRMAPLVLVTTLLTHLLGGSAGREGTAVQMGGGLAGGFLRLFRLQSRWHRSVLMAGMAAGFGAVFGTPWAGALFAMEVLAIGQFDYRRAGPCVVAAWVGDATCTAWGIVHTAYSIGDTVIPSGDSIALFYSILFGKVLLLGVGCGCVARLFVLGMKGARQAFSSSVKPWLLRPVVGGTFVVLGALVLGTRSYLGLGVTSPVVGEVTLLSCFQSGGAEVWSWLWKLLFTVVTLAAGFKGGEVTPLFFVGAAFGNTLAALLNAPVDLFAGLGFLAVFAGASNTPIACAVMGLELMGVSHSPWFALVCALSYLASGNAGLYSAQRTTRAKLWCLRPK